MLDSEEKASIIDALFNDMASSIVEVYDGERYETKNLILQKPFDADFRNGGPNGMKVPYKADLVIGYPDEGALVVHPKNEDVFHKDISQLSDSQLDEFYKSLVYQELKDTMFYKNDRIVIEFNTPLMLDVYGSDKVNQDKEPVPMKLWKMELEPDKKDIKLSGLLDDRHVDLSLSSFDFDSLHNLDDKIYGQVMNASLSKAMHYGIGKDTPAVIAKYAQDESSDFRFLSDGDIWQVKNILKAFNSLDFTEGSVRNFKDVSNKDDNDKDRTYQFEIGDYTYGVTLNPSEHIINKYGQNRISISESDGNGHYTSMGDYHVSNETFAAIERGIEKIRKGLAVNNSKELVDYIHDYGHEGVINLRKPFVSADGTSYTSVSLDGNDIVLSAENGNKEIYDTDNKNVADRLLRFLQEDKVRNTLKSYDDVFLKGHDMGGTKFEFYDGKTNRNYVIDSVFADEDGTVKIHGDNIDKFRVPHPVDDDISILGSEALTALDEDIADQGNFVLEQRSREPEFEKKYAPLDFTPGNEYKIHTDLGDDNFVISASDHPFFERNNPDMTYGYFEDNQGAGYVKTPKDGIQASHEVYEQMKAREDGKIMQQDPGQIYYAFVGHIWKGDSAENDKLFDEKKFDELADWAPASYDDELAMDSAYEGIDYASIYSRFYDSNSDLKHNIRGEKGESDRYAVAVLHDGDYKTGQNPDETDYARVYVKLTRNELLDRIRKMPEEKCKEIEHYLTPEIKELFEEVRKEEKDSKRVVPEKGIESSYARLTKELDKIEFVSGDEEFKFNRSVELSDGTRISGICKDINKDDSYWLELTTAHEKSLSEMVDEGSLSPDEAHKLYRAVLEAELLSDLKKYPAVYAEDGRQLADEVKPLKITSSDGSKLSINEIYPDIYLDKEGKEVNDIYINGLSFSSDFWDGIEGNLAGMPLLPDDAIINLRQAVNDNAKEVLDISSQEKAKEANIKEEDLSLDNIPVAAPSIPKSKGGWHTDNQDLQRYESTVGKIIAEWKDNYAAEHPDNPLHVEYYNSDLNPANSLVLSIWSQTQKLLPIYITKERADELGIEISAFAKKAPYIVGSGKDLHVTEAVSIEETNIFKLAGRVPAVKAELDKLTDYNLSVANDRALRTSVGMEKILSGKELTWPCERIITTGAGHEHNLNSVHYNPKDDTIYSGVPVLKNEKDANKRWDETTSALTDSLLLSDRIPQKYPHDAIYSNIARVINGIQTGVDYYKLQNTDSEKLDEPFEFVKDDANTRRLKTDPKFVHDLLGVTSKVALTISSRTKTLDGSIKFEDNLGTFRSEEENEQVSARLDNSQDNSDKQEEKTGRGLHL